MSSDEALTLTQNTSTSLHRLQTQSVRLLSPLTLTRFRLLLLSLKRFLVDCSVTAAAHTEPFPSLTSRGTQGPRPFSLSRELRLCHVTTGRRRNSTSCFLLGAPLQWKRAVLRTHRLRSPSPEVRSTLWSRSSSARTHTNLNAQPC